jgi:hypothetical protein
MMSVEVWLRPVAVSVQQDAGTCSRDGDLLSNERNDPKATERNVNTRKETQNRQVDLMSSWQMNGHQRRTNISADVAEEGDDEKTNLNIQHNGWSVRKPLLCSGSSKILCTAASALTIELFRLKIGANDANFFYGPGWLKSAGRLRLTLT